MKRLAVSSTQTSNSWEAACASPSAVVGIKARIAPLPELFWIDKKTEFLCATTRGSNLRGGRSEAIEYSKKLAEEIRRGEPKRDADLSIVVIDESGTEIHSEPVYAPG